MVAKTLGVSNESLRRLELGFNQHAYTFPMRDSSGEIVGFRLRPFKDVTKKYTETGSKNGLFVPLGVYPRNVQLINEGESCAAAGLTLGFAAIGRPGAMECIEETVRYLLLAPAPVICPCIVADNDTAGEEGTEALAEATRNAGIPYRVLFPPTRFKDLREWLNGGGLTWKILSEAIHAQKIVYPADWIGFYSQQPNHVVRSGLIRQVEASAYSILAVIEGFRGADGWCRVGRDEISELTGLSVSQIDRQTAKLRRMGLLVWKRGGKDRVNQFLPNWGPCHGSKRQTRVFPMLWFEKNSVPLEGKKTSRTVKKMTTLGGRLLSEQQAIDYLGLAERPNPQGALRWLMRTRKVAYVKLAKGIYAFRQADLDAFVESCRVPAG